MPTTCPPALGLRHTPGPAQPRPEAWTADFTLHMVPRKHETILSFAQSRRSYYLST